MFSALNGLPSSVEPTKGTLSWQVDAFERLGNTALYRILQLRVNVFVVEQQCPYPELDDQDQTAWHLQGYVDGELAAYARILPPKADGLPIIGRVVVAPAYRGLKLGEQLMQRAMEWTRNAFPQRQIEIGAQHRLQAFYMGLGFTAVGEPYDEDGIQHIKMLSQK
ncbi:GNAT family N-acetyltransferase [Salinispirillum sp. LH 10-3-1]|uniref:GNAT family N-acetyltransferase n=1 Tax=Salinispirillum sp. LH 10-3-1 TaxID=2952525 RepID=A0AB38YDP6_9GAMM